MDKNTQLQKLLGEARELLKTGDVAGAQAKRAEAQTVISQIEEEKELDKVAAKYQPNRPMLPDTDGQDGAVPEVATAKSKGKGGKGSGTSTLVAETDDENEEEDLATKTLGAAYLTRFGDEKSIIKSILTDLHGAGYQGKYWDQKRAFNKYLRGGEPALKNDDRKALTEVIFNPTALKMALDQGVTDLNSLRATMVEAADTLGGYLVPVDFQMRMIERLAALTMIRGRASQMNTSRDRVEMPEATGGDGRFTSPVRIQWVDETPTIGQLTPNYVTFGLRAINVHTAMAETPLSRNLLEDIAFDIEGYLSKKLAEAVALDEDKQFMVGNGVGKPKGILPNSINGMAIPEVNSGGASTLTWNGLIALTYGIAAQYRQGGVWLANRATYLAIAKMQDTTSGNYLWTPYQFVGGEGGRLNTLLGFPILESELMPDIGAGAFPIVFGDLGAYQIVDRLGMTVERFLDSQTARQNLVYFVMRRRLGGELIETWKLAVQKVSA